MAEDRTRAGEVLEGFLRNRSAADLQLQAFEGSFSFLPTADVTALRERAGSMMPVVEAGPRDVQDLLAFLSRQDGGGALARRRGCFPAGPRLRADCRAAPERVANLQRPAGRQPAQPAGPDRARQRQPSRCGLDLPPRFTEPARDHARRGRRRDVRDVHQRGPRPRRSARPSHMDLQPAPHCGHSGGRRPGGRSRRRAAGRQGLRGDGSRAPAGVGPADHAQNTDATAAPLALDGRIVSGISGGDQGARGFLAAFDPSTGAEQWRFWTVPLPGEPSAESWRGSVLPHGCATT